MGFIEVLTLIFIVLKLIGIITWSWWTVFTPFLIAFAIYILLAIALAYRRATG